MEDLEGAVSVFGLKWCSSNDRTEILSQGCDDYSLYPRAGGVTKSKRGGQDGFVAVEELLTRLVQKRKTWPADGGTIRGQGPKNLRSYHFESKSPPPTTLQRPFPKN